MKGEGSLTGTWVLGQPIRRALAKAVLDLRAALEDDFGKQLRALGIREDGIQPPPAGRTLTPAEQRLRDVASAVVRREVEGGTAKGQAFEAYVSDSAFTFLNRMVGLRCLEERGLLLVDGQPETAIKVDPARNASSLYWRVRNELGSPTPPREVWRETLRRAGAAISEQVRVLFDPESEYAALLPMQPTLQRVVDALNATEIPPETFAQDELLVWVYQYYNAEEKDAVYERLGNGEKVEAPGQLAAATCLYTERFMVDYLLQNTLGALWVEMHPDSSLPERWPYFVRRPEGSARPQRQARPLREITVLDPACGSGHFLVRAFDLLLDMYREEGREPEREFPHLILECNLHGIDIDLRAIQIAALALYLKGCTFAGPGFRPRLLNLVSAHVILPGDDPPAQYLARFRGDPEAEALVSGIWQGLRNVREFGSLLHPERAVDELVKRKRERQRGQFWEWDDTRWTHWKRELLHGLRQEFERQAQSQDLGQKVFGREASTGISLVEALGKKYDVVVTNPPYAGNKNLNDRLRRFLEYDYADGKDDIYSAFMIRCQQFCSTGSFMGMLTQHGWMFLGGFESLRKGLVQQMELTTLCHLGPKTFKDLSNTNALGFTMFASVRRETQLESRCVFFRLARTLEKQHSLDLAIQHHRKGEYSPRSRVFVVARSELAKIPSAALYYWAPQVVLDLFGSGERMADVVEAKQGLITGDNERFLREFWETSLTIPFRWVPYMKGGDYCRWFGNTDLVVDWGQDGTVIKAFKLPSGKLKSRPQNVAFYGKEGATWTAQSSYGLSMRYMSSGFFFDAKGPGLFARRPENLMPIIGLFNTNLLQFLFGLVQPTVDFGEGYLMSLPFPRRSTALPTWSLVANLSVQALSIKQQLARTLPAERTFDRCRAENRGKTLTAVAQSRIVEQLAQMANLHWIEGVLAEMVIDLYGLGAEDRESIVIEEGLPPYWQPLVDGYDRPPSQVTATLEAHEKSARWGKRILTAGQRQTLTQTIRRLLQVGPSAIDWAVACSPVQYSSESTKQDADVPEVDYDMSDEQRASFPTETLLEELSKKAEIHPISVYGLLKELPEQEELLSPPLVRQALRDYVSITILRLLGYRWPEQDAYEREHGQILDPALAVEDGIIPLVPYGDRPTALERVRMRLERDFGPEGAEQSEREFRQWVGRDLDDWLRREFFKRHVQQFKQRPIAWHLVSPERTFEAFVLYHKLSRATLQKLRAQYAGGLIAQLRAEQERARQRGAVVEVSRLQLQIEDVEEFRARLEKIERGDGLQYRVRCRWKGEKEEAGRPGPYTPDIDDGVKINIRPFQEAGLLAVKEVIKKW